MDQAEVDHLREQIEQLARNRLPDPGVRQVVLWQYGDEPSIEPGELLVRLVLEPLEGQRPDGTVGDALVVEEFHRRRGPAIQGFRHDLQTVPQVAMVEFVIAGDGYTDERPGPSFRISQAEPDVALERTEAPLVPMMARLGPADLETVDTLITAGIASSRAEAVRWALARIRERPAYARLREHAREIEALKTEF
jgi:hypothetical protein